MEAIIFILFSAVAIAAVIASPVSFFNPRRAAGMYDERSEVIILNDLHRTTFRKY